jgi:hypothetical protein
LVLKEFSADAAFPPKPALNPLSVALSNNA